MTEAISREAILTSARQIWPDAVLVEHPDPIDKLRLRKRLNKLVLRQNELLEQDDGEPDWLRLLEAARNVAFGPGIDPHSLEGLDDDPTGTAPEQLPTPTTYACMEELRRQIEAVDFAVTIGAALENVEHEIAQLQQQLNTFPFTVLDRDGGLSTVGADTLEELATLIHQHSSESSAQRNDHEQTRPAPQTVQ